VTSLFSSSLRSKATNSAIYFSKLRKSITTRSGFITHKNGNYSYIVTVPESSQRRQILWNALEMPLNSKDVLSSFFKISFFPALNRKKTYAWNRHALYVCLSVSLPLIEPLNNLTDLHVRVIIKTTWTGRELLRPQHHQSRAMKQSFLILKMGAVHSFEISVVGTATMLRTDEKNFNF
jgi:hypothetical protein